MVSSPGNQSDLPTSPCEDFALYFSVGVVVVLPCIHVVVLSTSDCPLAKVRASPDSDYLVQGEVESLPCLINSTVELRYM